MIVLVLVVTDQNPGIRLQPLELGSQLLKARSDPSVAPLVVLDGLVGYFWPVGWLHAVAAGVVTPRELATGFPLIRRCEGVGMGGSQSGDDACHGVSSSSV
jgi:hypothetical protein